MKYLRLSAPAFAGLFLLAALTIYLDRAPAMLWDEGWTLSVARNWVELGHYGKLSLGEKAPAGLQLAFPVTGLVAFAFKYFGVGLFQARLAPILSCVPVLRPSNRSGYALGTFVDVGK